MFKLTLVIAGLLAGLALAVTAALGSSGSATARSEQPNGCQSSGGFSGICVDPIGDVKGVASGPDIVGLREDEWGVILFRVALAEGSRLAHSAAFTDKVSIFLTSSGYYDKQPRHYVLTVSAAHPAQEILRRLPNGKPIRLGGTGWPLKPPYKNEASFSRVHGNVVQFGVDSRLLGSPRATGVRYRAMAARVMHDGTTGSSDYAPNKGTGVWNG